MANREPNMLKHHTVTTRMLHTCPEMLVYGKHINDHLAFFQSSGIIPMEEHLSSSSPTLTKYKFRTSLSFIPGPKREAWYTMYAHA